MDRSPTLPLSAFIAITVVVGGIFWIKGPLESKRPTPETRANHHSFGQEDVNARLWQDPLAVARHHVNDPEYVNKSSSDSRHTLGSLGTSIARKSNVLVMPVMIPGGDYAEDVEQRRRTRKAVVAALGVAGYVPENGSSIGFVQTHWKRQEFSDDDPELIDFKSGPDGQKEDLVIPYEWFSWGRREPKSVSATTNGGNDILVLWLNESMMGKRVVGMLDKILGKLTRKEAAVNTRVVVDKNRIHDDVVSSGPPGLAGVHIVGPFSSTTVLGMMQKRSQRNAAGDTLQANEFRNLLAEWLGQPVLPEIQSSGVEELPELFEQYSAQAQYDNYCQLIRDLNITDPAKADSHRIAYDFIRTQADQYLIASDMLEIARRDSSTVSYGELLVDYASAVLEVSVAGYRPEDTTSRLFSADVDRKDIVATIEYVLKSSSGDANSVVPALTDCIADLFIDPSNRFLELTEAHTWRETAVHHWQLARTLPDTTSPDERIALHGTLNLLLTLPPSPGGTDGKTKPRRRTFSVEEIRRFTSAVPSPAYVDWLSRNVEPTDRDSGDWRWSVAAAWQRSQSDPKVKPTKPAHPMTFFSCRSTAAEELLLEELQIKVKDPDFARLFEERVGARFVRTIATDETLIATLSEELERRHVSLEDSTVHIALIGEWDTFYGRAIPRSFRDRLTSNRFENKRLHRFSYLMGLDGILPGTKNERESTDTDGNGKSMTSSTAFAPRPDDTAWPFGRNQLDNIQRLTTHLETLNEELEHENTSWRIPFKHGIDVIGVVGSDIYDKLLILQALTRRFPNAIFFTTDLDAQMLHPTQQSWARNVIVVSTYGLSLHEDHQQFTLPFRDSYQTATYAAALQAVGRLRRDLVLEPRIFEIGRHGLVDLSLTSDSGLHPPLDKMIPRFESWMVVIGLVAVGLATLAAAVRTFRFHRRVNRIAENGGDGKPRKPVDTPTLVAWTCGSILVGFVGLYWLSAARWDATGNEPLAAFGGVSAWPIQYWRWAVFVLSVAFFFNAYRVLGNHVERVESRFGLGARAWREQKERDSKDLENTLNHWEKYKQKGRWPNRARRVLSGMVIFGAFMAGLYLIYGLPPAPFRGDSILWIHWLLLLISGLAVATVTVFVLDAILICWSQILTLAPAQSGWPTRIINAFRIRLKVPEPITEPLNQVLDLEIVADTTRVVGNLLRWPFLLLFMMILSRNTLHESWNLTPTLLYTYGAVFAMALVSAIGLRTQASNARNHVLDNLRKWRCGIDPDQDEEAADEGTTSKEMQAHGADVLASETRKPTQIPDCSWIDRVSDHVMAMDKGAFAPWYRHPIVQSVLLPLSGLALITVTELIARSG